MVVDKKIKGQREADEATRRERPAAERTTLAISIILILGLLALVTHISITGQ